MRLFHKIYIYATPTTYITLFIEPLDRQVPGPLLPRHRSDFHAVQALRHVRGHLVEDDLPSWRNDVVPPYSLVIFLNSARSGLSMWAIILK
jgi:hypothetical protein